MDEIRRRIAESELETDRVMLRIEDGIGVDRLEGRGIRFRVARPKAHGIKAAKLVDFLLRKRPSLLGDREGKKLVTLLCYCLLKGWACVDGFETVERPRLHGDGKQKSMARCMVRERKPFAGRLRDFFY